MKRTLNATALLACLPAMMLFNQGCGREESFSDKNVILILVDTLRRDHLGAYGSEKALSPCMDRLADEGFSFKNALAPSSWTKPSVASLLTGLYPSRHGAIGCLAFLPGRSTLDARHTTVAESFQEAGFKTAAFVTNPHIITRYGFNQGFDHFMQPAGHAGELLGKALGWIEEAEGNKEKFFLFLHVIDPHMPYFPPEDYRDRFTPRDLDPRAPLTHIGNPGLIQVWAKQYHNWENGKKNDPFEFDVDILLDKLGESKWSGEALLSAEDTRQKIAFDFEGWDDPLLRRRVKHLTALYDGELAYTDDSLDFFLRRLEEKELLNRTVVVFTADHGEAFLEHCQWGHGGTVHREEVDVPLIFRIPGREGPIRGSYDGPVSLVDVYPTLLDAFGISPPPGMDGCSLFEVIRNPDRIRRERSVVLSETIQKWGDATSAAAEGIKLIRTQIKDGGVHWQLYDLKNDPLEKSPGDLNGGGDVAKALKRSIEELVSQRKPGGDEAGEEVELTEDEVRQLKELGYF